MKLLHRPSPNFDDRHNGIKPEMIILHFTGMKSTEAALDHLSSPASKVSCHYLIDETGNIHQMVDEEKRAWHAGISSWHGKDDINSRSIGIEISNRDGKPYTREQLFVLALLCKDLMHRHNIPPENIQGHSDIAPDRKQDPGAHFPWEKLARHGIGVWPKVRLRDKFNAAAATRKPHKLRTLFKKAGYPEQPSLPELVISFQRHYEPEVFKTENAAGKATASTIAKLRALVGKSRLPPL